MCANTIKGIRKSVSQIKKTIAIIQITNDLNLQIQYFGISINIWLMRRGKMGSISFLVFHCLMDQYKRSVKKYKNSMILKADTPRHRPKRPPQTVKEKTIEVFRRMILLGFQFYWTSGYLLKSLYCWCMTKAKFISYRKNLSSRENFISNLFTCLYLCTVLHASPMPLKSDRNKS